MPLSFPGPVVCAMGERRLEGRCVWACQNFKLDLLRTLGALISNLLKAICKSGNGLYGSAENTLIAINERRLHMGRMCLAILAPPGYVLVSFSIFALVRTT